MAKEIKVQTEATNLICNGVNKLANIVKLTLGPKGKNVALDRKFTTPLITNDGVTIAKEIELENKFENMGVKLVKEVCIKTNDVAGDGTTTAIVLAQKLINEGLKQISFGASPILLNMGIRKACEFCTQKLKEKSIAIKSNADIESVASISSGSEEIGKLIASAYKKLNRFGTITLQNSKTSSTEIVFEDGISFNKGYISPHLCNNLEKLQVEYDDCYLLLTDKKINNFNEILPILELVLKENKPLVIVCDSMSDEVLNNIIINKARGVFMCCVVKAPFYGEKRLEFLSDVATLTNTTLFTENNNFNEITLNELAKLKQAKISAEKTTIVTKISNKQKVNERINYIKTKMEQAKTDYEKEELKARLNNLSGGIATIFVGAVSEIEQQEKRLRIEDAISATSCALEFGILPGGGTSLIKLEKPLKKFISALRNEEKLGAEVFYKILREPLTQIVKNCECVSPEVVIEKVIKNKSETYGFNALTQKFVDCLTSGIIDPTKVTITALENAVSVAVTMLTTCALITSND